MSSQIGTVLDTLRANLAALYPSRAVTRTLFDFGDRKHSDLTAGVYTLLCLGTTGPQYEAHINLMLVGQTMVAETAAGESLEEAELVMMDEVYAWAERSMTRIDIAEITQSRQMETPYGWINARCKTGPFDLSGGMPDGLGDFTRFHADYDLTATSAAYVEATATLTIVGGVITAATVTRGGKGYTRAPEVLLYGPGAGAVLTATAAGGVVTGIAVSQGGAGYTQDTKIALAWPMGGKRDAQDDVNLPGP